MAKNVLDSIITMLTFGEKKVAEENFYGGK